MDKHRRCIGCLCHKCIFESDECCFDHDEISCWDDEQKCDGFVAKIDEEEGYL